MSKLRYATSISLDGFTAGPEQSLENPIGIGGMQLHEWVFDLAVWRSQHGQEGGVTNASSAVIEEGTANIGASIMGRNMFGGGPGPWGEPPWLGWWGDEPPFHYPVFVLTHHPREPLVLTGTTFTFVTEGPERALELARAAADGRDVAINGGASTARQYLGRRPRRRADLERRPGATRRGGATLRRSLGARLRAGPRRRGARRDAPDVSPALGASLSRVHGEVVIDGVTCVTTLRLQSDAHVALELMDPLVIAVDDHVAGCGSSDRDEQRDDRHRDGDDEQSGVTAVLHTDPLRENVSDTFRCQNS